MNVTWLISAVGLLAGAFFGLALALRPRLVRRFVDAETAPAELRCVLGASVAAIHLAALFFFTINFGYEDALFGALTAGAAAAVGACWLGAATGRFYALARDGRVKQWRACAPEAAMGLVIAAPWFLWLAVALTA